MSLSREHSSTYPGAVVGSRLRLVHCEGGPVSFTSIACLGRTRAISSLVGGQGAVLELVSPLERYRTREMAFYLFALLI